MLMLNSRPGYLDYACISDVSLMINGIDCRAHVEFSFFPGSPAEGDDPGEVDEYGIEHLFLDMGDDKRNIDQLLSIPGILEEIIEQLIEKRKAQATLI